MDGCDFREVARVSTMSACRLRKGKVKGKPIKSAGVCASLGSVGTTITMDTGRQPFYQQDGTHYIKPLQHMLAGFKNFDPVVEKKLVCHPDLPEFVRMFANRGHITPMQNTDGDLIVIAFYYLLRVG